MLYLEYIVLAALVVFLSVRLSYYVDCLDKKTNLSGAFIGGVMLAAVTSLPELFTSLTAVLALDQPDLVQGNVLGSNIFNLCVIGGLMLFTSRRYQRATLSKSHSKTLLFGLVMYALVFAAIMMPKEVGFSFLKVNLMSILILLVYAVNVKFMGNDDSGNGPPCGGAAAGGYGCRGNLPGSGYLTAGAECFCQSGTDWKFQRILR